MKSFISLLITCGMLFSTTTALSAEAAKIDCNNPKNASKIQCKPAPKPKVKANVKTPDKVRKAPDSVKKKAEEANKK